MRFDQLSLEQQHRIININGPINEWNTKTIFSLSALGLTEIPEEIFDIPKLTSLDISENKLTALSGSIGNMTSLKDLFLDENNLSSLPGEIGKLTKLERLHLHDNKLVNLPNEFKKLTNLSGLTVFRNPMVKLWSDACSELRSNSNNQKELTTQEYMQYYLIVQNRGKFTKSAKKRV